MNENCGKYSNVPVERAKDLVKADLIKNNEADRHWPHSFRPTIKIRQIGVLAHFFDRTSFTLQHFTILTLSLTLTNDKFETYFSSRYYFE